MCAHSTLALDAPLSAAFGIILGTAAHAVGWPVPAGGAQSITDALIALFKNRGGKVSVGEPVRALPDNYDLTLCDVTPRQFLEMAKGQLRAPFRRLLEEYRYGPGVCKVDFALNAPIPWRANECREAITVHLGGTLDELAASEHAVNQGRVPERPFVLLAQPSLFDPTRAPHGHDTAWAYCHMPNGSTESALPQIEAQIERFAPGFRDCVVGRAVHTAAQMQKWNWNLIGGDINGGVPDVKQFILRPTWRRYRTPLPGVYLCSSATPPGGGVHGMCGYWAAEWALSDLQKARGIL
jgi:phytoene dehydrogenase-like protein